MFFIWGLLRPRALGHSARRSYSSTGGLRAVPLRGHCPWKEIAALGTGYLFHTGSAGHCTARHGQKNRSILSCGPRIAKPCFWPLNSPAWHFFMQQLALLYPPKSLAYIYNLGVQKHHYSSHVSSSNIVPEPAKGAVSHFVQYCLPLQYE